tara:strand:+ start:156 stop:683 length:528 start_codon:yes stop_codon:yes gene_type:complete
MYFANFPLIPYDSVGDGNFKLVTNLLKRVAVRSKVKSNTSLFDTYTVKEGQTPEIIADKLYGDPNLHWIVMYVNDITDRYHQWPMTSAQFLSFINEKYSDPDGIHHYEITQTSGNTTVKIDIGTDNTDHSGATAITNREFEEKRQDTLRQIRLLDPAYVGQFIDEFQSLIGASVL